MKNKLILLWGLITVLGSLSLQAQEKKSLTLQEAIDMSLRNSHSLKGSQAKIDAATAAVREAMDRQLPDAKVSGSYLRFNNPNINLKSNSNNNGGGNQNGETPKINQAMYGMVSLSLPIYAGGQIRYGIESSRYLAEATKLDADYQHDEVVQNAVQSYVNLYKARAAVDLVKESLQQSQGRVTEFSRLESNGLLARNDLLKAQLQASNKELALLDAQNNWQLANVNMNLLLGLPENTELVLDSVNLDQQRELKPLEEYIQAGLNNRKDVASLDLRKKAAQTNVKATKGEMYPSLALTGGYIAADIPNFLTVTNAVNIGVGVSYNIGSLWKTKAKVQQAEAHVREINEDKAQKNDDVRLQINRSYLDWLSIQKKIQVYQVAVQQAAENYRITKNKHDNSLATTTDLLDADVAQLEANVNYVLVRADAIAVYNNLLKSAGMLDNADKK